MIWMVSLKAKVYGRVFSIFASHEVFSGKFGQRYEMFWTKRYKGDESASMDMDQEGATLKNRGG